MGIGAITNLQSPDSPASDEKTISIRLRQIVLEGRSHGTSEFAFPPSQPGNRKRTREPAMCRICTLGFDPPFRSPTGLSRASIRSPWTSPCDLSFLDFRTS
jgi:hypothetical protein